LPHDLQPKLLRVLENGEYQRVGETQTRVSKARIIAATNRDLRQEIKGGRFRADLYHRLIGVHRPRPAMREMGNDRLLLLDHFRQRYADTRHIARHSPSMLQAAERCGLAYAFPGNVRELRNIVIRLTATPCPAQMRPPSKLLAEFDAADRVDRNTRPPKPTMVEPGRSGKQLPAIGTGSFAKQVSLESRRHAGRMGARLH
jgi:transcriptional regulator with GAF, ATPase, and Fis domain